MEVGDREAEAAVGLEATVGGEHVDCGRLEGEVVREAQLAVVQRPLVRRVGRAAVEQRVLRLLQQAIGGGDDHCSTSSRSQHGPNATDAVSPIGSRDEISHRETYKICKYAGENSGKFGKHRDTIFPHLHRRYAMTLVLNDDYEGGRTEFPNLNKEYKLKKGDALFFHTLNNYECMTKKALHGGKPVESGEKWVCNLWIRKYEFSN